MPVYTYKCSTCFNTREELFSSFKDRMDFLFCRDCHGSMKIIPSRPLLDFTMDTYRKIEKKGHAIVEKGMARDAKRNKEAIVAKENKKRRDYVAAKVREFPYSASDVIKGD